MREIGRKGHAAFRFQFKFKMDTIFVYSADSRTFIAFLNIFMRDLINIGIKISLTYSLSSTSAVAAAVSIFRYELLWVNCTLPEKNNEEATRRGSYSYFFEVTG